ncbi:hypothetical protein NEOKW01_0614 [Nematocida sp. AWRm80]|nr:hypothetical protein NEOKW01_0614 [Nematocida sp. AWRm80]
MRTDYLIIFLLSIYTIYIASSTRISQHTEATSTITISRRHNRSNRSMPTIYAEHQKKTKKNKKKKKKTASQPNPPLTLIKEDKEQDISSRIEELEEKLRQNDMIATDILIDNADSIYKVESQVSITRHDIIWTLLPIGIYTVLMFGMIYFDTSIYEVLNSWLQSVLSYIPVVNLFKFDILSLFTLVFYMLFAAVHLKRRKIEGKFLTVLQYGIVPIIFLSIFTISNLHVFASLGIPFIFQVLILLAHVLLLLTYSSSGCASTNVDMNVPRIALKAFLLLVVPIIILTLISVILQLVGFPEVAYYLYLSGLWALFFGMFIGLNETIKELIFSLLPNKPIRSQEEIEKDRKDIIHNHSSLECAPITNPDIIQVYVPEEEAKEKVEEEKHRNAVSRYFHSKYHFLKEKCKQKYVYSHIIIIVITIVSNILLLLFVNYFGTVLHELLLILVNKLVALLNSSFVHNITDWFSNILSRASHLSEISHAIG